MPIKPGWAYRNLVLNPSGGQVGIGTTTPGSPLTVGAPAYSGVGTTAMIKQNNTNVFGGLWLEAQSNPDSLTLGHNGTSAYITTNYSGAGGTTPMNIYTYGNANQLYLATSGSVGIGTAGPDNTLSVNGTADKASGGTTWGTFSDIRLKNVDGPYASGLAQIMQLQPVMFHYKPGNPLNLPSNEQNYGFIAQDVQKVMPEAVVTSSNGYLQLSADPILWSMVNAIKEQQGEIASLSASLDSIGSRITIDNSGNVGIGTTGPGATLDVAGSFRVYGGNTSLESVYGNLGIVQIGSFDFTGGLTGAKLDINNGHGSPNTAQTAIAITAFPYANQCQVPWVHWYTAWGASSGGITVNCQWAWNTEIYGDQGLSLSGHGLDSNEDVKIDGNGYVTFRSGHNDLAENYLLNGSAKRSEIVGFDPQNKNQVTLASNSQSMMGVISASPGAIMDATAGFAIGASTKENYTNEKVPVAAVGSIPVIITGQPGSITNGDPISLSTMPGIGAKATTAGRIVGSTLESNSSWDEQTCPAVVSIDSITWPDDNGINSQHPCFRLPDGTYIGKLMLFLDISWYDPQVQLTSSGDLNLVDQQLSNETISLQGDALEAQGGFTVPHYYTLNDALGNPIARVGEFSDAAIANLRAGGIYAQQITTNALSVTTENITINGQNIRDYIAGIVTSIINSTNNNLVSPIASADEIHTNFISPVDNSSNIGLKFDNSKLSILNGNSASSSAVSSFDNAGNATFSGQLSSNSLNTNDASISGTLHVGKIIADQIEGLSTMNNQPSTASSTYVTNNYYNSTSSATNSNFGLVTGQATPGTSSATNNYTLAASPYLDISSLSGQLTYVDNLSAVTASFSQNLMVFGQTSLSDTSIVGQLSVDGSLILANNSINVLGSDLSLQPLRQGGLSVMGGLFYIDTEGNLKVGGNAEFAKNVTVGGTLAAGIISPLPGSDLSLNTGNSNLNVNNASNSAVLSVNSLGDLVASGAATIAKLNLSLIQPAFAVSPSEVIATGSAGTTQITAHQTEVTIDNPLVTDKSLIYITPTSNTNNQVLYLLRQVPDQSFTVGMQNPNAISIPFNWIIVN
jgi:hypothetical protein